MSNPEVNENMVEFHHAFVESLDEFIIDSVEIGESKYDLEASDAFSMMASRMMFVVVRGIVKGGCSKDSFIETLEHVYEVTKLSLAEPEGGLQ